MHICFVAIDYHSAVGGGGLASYVATLGGALVAQGHRVTVLASGARYQMSAEDGLQIIRAPLGNLHWYLYRLRAPSIGVLPLRELEWSLAIRRALGPLLAAGAVDAIEISEVGALFLAGARHSLPPLIVRLHGAPYVFRKRSGQPISLGERMSWRMELAAMRRAAAVTAPSHFQAQEVAGDLGWPAGRIHVVPNPLDPQLARHVPTFSSAGSAPPLVLYTGQVAYHKGVLSLLAAVPHLAQAVPDVQVAIAGARHTSIDDHALECALDQAGARARVRLLGHVPRERLPDWYCRAAVFALPSYYETFGISAIEAMACGLPVVATTAGGLPEVVEDGVTGLLTPPGDARALAEAITRLLRDPALRERMGRAGRERALAYFMADRVAERMTAVYEQVARDALLAGKNV